MCVMSLIESRRPVRRSQASIPQIVVGTLVSLLAMLSVQMSALTAYVDVFAGPGGISARKYDELGRRFTGWTQFWHQYGSLLWGVYALVLLLAVVWMWRAILTRPTRGAWGVVPVVLVLSLVFWALNLDRFGF
jgi:hypothetical protein